MSPDARRLLLRRIIAAHLSPAALTLALVLMTRTDDPTRPFVCYYDDLSVLIGPRRRGARTAGRKVVADAAAELVAAGVVARERKANRLGRTDGPETPYLWWFTRNDESPLAEDGEWAAWPDAALAAVALAPKAGPVAIAAYVRTAVAADAAGVLCATLPALKTLTRLEHKTAEKHLAALARIGAVRVSARTGGRRLVVLKFAVAAPQSPREEAALIGRISAAHERTKQRRARGKPYPIAPPAVPRVMVDVAQAMEELAAASSLEGANRLRQVISAMETGGRSFSAEQICDGFIAPVLAEQLRRRNDRGFTERVLGKILRRARKADEPPIGNFARYFAGVAKSEPRFLATKNPRHLLARDENGHPFFLAQMISERRR